MRGGNGWGGRLALLAGGLALVACGDAGAGGTEQDTAATAAAAPDFDGAAAYGLLEEQVGFGPRVPGSPGHAAQLEWMSKLLREHADTVLLQPFTHTTAAGETLRLTNVFARFAPERSDRILLVAHWDTRSIAEMDADPARRDQPILGANDGASGTAVLLQLARMFGEDPPPVGVDLLLVDGEDYAPGEMYLGAKHFAANQPEGYQPLYGILLDMIGDSDPVFPVEGYSNQYAPEVVQRVWSTADRIGYGSMFPMRLGGTIEDDHVPLNQAGIRTIDIIDFEYGPGNTFWHTHMDDLSAVSVRGLEAVGSVVAALVYSGG